MTDKCIQWSDDLALPKFADRETCRGNNQSLLFSNQSENNCDLATCSA